MPPGVLALTDQREAACTVIQLADRSIAAQFRKPDEAADARQSMMDRNTDSTSHKIQSLADGVWERRRPFLAYIPFDSVAMAVRVISALH